MSLRVIPVLDVKAGQAVHAVAGQRAHYRPVQSRLHATSDPIGLARAYRDVLGLDALYVADLDAIEGRWPHFGLYRALAELGLELWVDAGLRDVRDAAALVAGFSENRSLEGGRKHEPVLVVGLETVAGPAALRAICGHVGPRRIAFSLDLRDGRPLCASNGDWGTDDPEAIVAVAVALGVGRVILLDLARVGTGQGVGTLSLLTRLAVAYPHVALLAGGGVASRADLDPLEAAGAAAVLLGSALHDGRITAVDLAPPR
jgi:phosphoribosylformimino-5-aminoimidazole carboxamide ribotide isomerase